MGWCSIALIYRHTAMEICLYSGGYGGFLTVRCGKDSAAVWAVPSVTGWDAYTVMFRKKLYCAAAIGMWEVYCAQDEVFAAVRPRAECNGLEWRGEYALTLWAVSCELWAVSCEDYGTGCLHVKYLLQICGHLRCGERLFILREYGAVAKHRDIVQVKRRGCKRRISLN